MKVLIIFLSLVFMGCVTANTRDLSAINPKTEPAEKSFILPSPLMLVDDYEDCMVVCKEEGGNSRGCHSECGFAKFENKKPLKVADYATCMQSCREDLCGGGHRSDCDNISDSLCSKYCSDD